MPLAKEREIPLSTDWVVTMFTPVEKVLKMYKEDVLKTYGKDNEETWSTITTNQGSVKHLDYLSKNNKARPKIVVGFSAETENVIQNSKIKIKEKYCDLIVANDVSEKDSGFNSDYNKVSIIDVNSDGIV